MFGACDVEDPVIIKCFWASKPLISMLSYITTFQIYDCHKNALFLSSVGRRKAYITQFSERLNAIFLQYIYLQIIDFALVQLLPLCKSSSICECYAAYVADP